jgi:hypothetical protein
MRRWLGTIGAALVTLGIIDVVAFDIHFHSLGGSAVSGKVVDGRYMVGNHGTYTDVPEARWRWMRAHEISVWITMPLAILVGGPLMLLQSGPKPRLIKR